MLINSLKKINSNFLANIKKRIVHLYRFTFTDLKMQMRNEIVSNFYEIIWYFGFFLRYILCNIYIHIYNVNYYNKFFDFHDYYTFLMKLFNRINRVYLVS